MAECTVLILNVGGSRSLVATAAIMSEANVQRVSLLQVRDGRAGAEKRLEYAWHQAR